MKVAIITAIYDGYDTLKPPLPQEGVDAEWIFVTDSPQVTDGPGWQVIYEPQPGLHPNRAAKRPKYTPWRYTDAECSIWIDASFRIKSPTFALDVLKYVNTELPFGSPIAQFKHPWRDCAYAEALESANLPKYRGEPVYEQARAYEKQGFPKNWGLWATGVIVRKHTSLTKLLGLVWKQETSDWSFQDQISEPYALWRVGLRPNGLPGTHFANPWLNYEGSGRHWMKIEIGGGHLVERGWTNLDFRNGSGEWRRLAQDAPWPTGESTVDAIRASHVMEHIPAGQERIDVFNEAHRVLKPGGTFEIIVPLMTGTWHAIADPTHVSFWCLESFHYFDGHFAANADYGILPWGTKELGTFGEPNIGRWVGTPR